MNLDHKLLKNYALIDFGAGRKLESVDGYLIDRPCPAAIDFPKRQGDCWAKADAVFDRDGRGEWAFRTPWPEQMFLQASAFNLNAAPKPFGHIGFFPEQAGNWEWLAATAKEIGATQAMNLFAYSGGSTLALAAAGCEVVHVDSSKPSVSRARENALASGLEDAPVRYIVEDAKKFAAREIRRGREHNLIVLDPPAYGHSAGGKAWRLERDVWPLLEDCIELLTPRSALLMTGHTETVRGEDVVAWLRSHRPQQLTVESHRNTIRDRANRKLDTGYWVRATWNLESR